IFDALEKADKTTLDPFKVHRLPEKERAVSDQEEKVVSFVAAPLHNNSMQLDAKLVAYHNPQSVEAELFKVLRTNLLFPDTGKPARSILVTSAVPGDGKSFVSANLAISIAQGVEDYVLLMDCDIRRPSLQTYFGFSQTKGLSDYLNGQSPLENLLYKTPIAKLSLLPGGRPPRNPTELLSSKKMQGLLEEVTKRYDDRFIIIDSPPPSMAAEVTAIAKYVDGVLLVIRAGKTPRQAVAETIEQIGKEKVLGIVLNQAQQSVKKYYGYSKNYYH
ncbi:MAG: polysaccharide biosynthesis tyrosine autokinase, partial [Desulfatitalea sp.]|nr:polysaccharide biosynthesis tyrosine autokinase [Desulfatitalea sp.]